MFDTHCEKELIINGRELKYEGIFHPHELFSMINKMLAEKGYVKKEKKSEETVTESGRGTYIELRPYKQKTEYVTLMIKLKIHLTGLTEAVEEVRGERGKFQKGDVTIIFDAWSLTDYEFRWGMKPWVFFFKGIINKFAFVFPMEPGFKAELQADTDYFYRRLRDFLATYKGKEVPIPTEEEITKEVSEEVRKEILEGLKRQQK